MKRKAVFCLALSVLLLFGMLGALWAYLLCTSYNRPNPLMDYVSQDRGIYDTMYENFTASDCRGCHGDLTGDLHRLTGLGLNGECSAPQCHPGGPPAPGTQLSCVDPSCHVYPNKVHHGSDLAVSGQCTACHRPDMVARLRGVEPLVYYPSDPAPTPFRCENCHWEATIWMDPDPEVNSLYDLHHMGDYGPVAPQCYDCHAMAYGDPQWPLDFTNSILIRTCENCHTKDTLHAVHAEDSYGWEAVGFHVPESNNNCSDVAPDTYRLFTSEEKCVACHGELPAGSPIPGPQLPAIDSVDPRSGSNITIMILGSNFGSSGPEAWLVFTPRVGDTSNPVIIPSTDSSVFGWYEDHILVHTPDGSPGGNYDLQVRTGTGLSNRLLFTLTGTGSPPPVPGTPAITAISPTVGTDDMLVTLEGSNFGDRHCCDREVYFKLVGSPNDPASMPVYSWTDTQVVVRLLPWNPPVATPGIYSVAVHNGSGDSNVVNFTYRESLGGADLTRNGLALTLSGEYAAFGDLQSEVFGDNYGYSSQVKIGDRNHTYTATHITSWTATQIDLILDSFVDENGTPVSELIGEYGLLVETTYFYDTTLNGQLDPAGDHVYHRVTSSLEQLLIPICECDLVPDATIIPRGGTLGFDITVTNNTNEVQVFGFATYATKPGGGKYPPSGYLIGPARVSLNPYGSRSAHRSHPIPGNVPLGTYTYYGVVGTPGAGLYDECQFEFEVTVP